MGQRGREQCPSGLAAGQEFRIPPGVSRSAGRGPAPASLGLAGAKLPQAQGCSQPRGGLSSQRQWPTLHTHTHSLAKPRADILSRVYRLAHVDACSLTYLDIHASTSPMLTAIRSHIEARSHPPGSSRGKHKTLKIAVEKDCLFYYEWHHPGEHEVTAQSLNSPIQRSRGFLRV